MNFKSYLTLFLFSFSALYSDPLRILIGSPVRQKPKILSEFLQSLNRLDSNNICFDYYFVDDNTEINSSKLLKEFSSNCATKVIIDNPTKSKKNDYICNETTHFWSESAIWKVANFKENIIHYSIKHDYDYLFLIDSDLVLHPFTIQQLLLANKDIISNIFWTKFSPQTHLVPQIWLYDSFSFYKLAPNEILSEDEKTQKSLDYYKTLLTPGVYPVGGLGACTLISKKALRKGVSFKKMNNLSLSGEDRHFCVRALALGFELFVDTHHPAYHIYRESNLAGVSDYIQKTKTFNY